MLDPLQNEPIRKYFSPDDDPDVKCCCVIGSKCRYHSETLAYNILTAMQETIKKGDKFLSLDSFGSASVITHTGSLPDVPFHPFALRLPDRFQGTEKKACNNSSCAVHHPKPKLTLCSDTGCGCHGYSDRCGCCCHKPAPVEGVERVMGINETVSGPVQPSERRVESHHDVEEFYKQTDPVEERINKIAESWVPEGIPPGFFKEQLRGLLALVKEEKRSG